MGLPLFVVHTDSVLQALVRRAAAKEFSIRPVRSWTQLRTALARDSRGAIALVDPHLGSGDRLASDLRSIRDDFPSVPLIAAPGEGCSRADLHTLGRWGITSVILMEEHGIPEISRVLCSARRRPLEDVLTRCVTSTTSQRARRILHAAIEVAAAGRPGEALARALHMSPRTLLRWCAAEALPPPRRMLAWMRILLAAELLERSTRTVESIAFSCGYASASGLRRALHDLLGRGPQELRLEGVLGIAAEAFGRELRQHTGRIASTRPPSVIEGVPHG